MSLTIPDEILKSTGMTEAEARVEIACRLYETEKISLQSAAQWVGSTRIEFEEELLQRGIAIYRPTVQDLSDDMNTLDRLGGGNDRRE